MSKSNDIFKNNPRLDVVYTTSDGIFFYTKSAAKNHGKTLKDKKVKKITRPVVSEKKEDPKLSAEERIEAIKKLTTIEAVKNVLKGEAAKTVKAAGVAKIEELKAALEAADSTQNPPA